MSIYHIAEAGICVRAYETGGWGKPKALLPGARGGFTASAAADGRIYVFAQDAEGSMHLCTGGADGWNEQTILRSRVNAAYTTYFHALVSDAGMHLLYNMPSGVKNGQQLVSQRLGADGQWGAANPLGGVTPIGGRLFRTQAIGPGHMLLLCQSCEPDCNLGYREVTMDRVGGLRVLHTTGYQIADTSFLATPDCLHALYIVKSPFSCQLMYRRRDGVGFTDPVVLWEAQRMDSCLLYFAEGRLQACCMSGGQIYACAAGESGAFSRPVRMRAAFASEPMKAEYLSAPGVAAAFDCRELYVERARPWEAQLLGIPAAVFFPLQIRLDLPTPPPVPVEAVAPERPQGVPAEAVMQLRMQLDKALRDNTEKDMRIKYMEARLYTMEAEAFAVEGRLRERLERAEAALAGRDMAADGVLPVDAEEPADMEMNDDMLETVINKADDEVD